MSNKSEHYIGLMSGTSLDAIDVALMDFGCNTPQLITTHQHPIPAYLRQEIADLCTPGDNAIQRMGEVDVKLGHLLADSVLALLSTTRFQAEDIRAVGSHGQTIRHMPNAKFPFTLQIGDPNIIAARTQITTVADFRRRDMALGGEAAPLAPAFHNFLFQTRQENVGVLNIGGIANITYLPADTTEAIIGFDTGPGNTLMDAWCLQHTGEPYDKNGEWASSGRCDDRLLKQLLADPYFNKSAPKSTGREYFHLDWLQKQISDCNFTSSSGLRSTTATSSSGLQSNTQGSRSTIAKPENIQATLLELTARSIANAANSHVHKNDVMYLCGGGAQNTALINRIQALCTCAVKNTEQIGIHPNWIEAAAFAWLARQTIQGKPGNIPSVTGASAPCILGAIYS